MQGTYLKFYVHENRDITTPWSTNGCWSRRRSMGIHGGSAFKAIAGFGRHGVLHEDHFFELAGDLPVEVGFIVSEEEAERLLEMIRSEGLTLFYVKMPAEYGVINGSSGLES